ncbi:FGGY family carbohydrate kinase [Daejeonella sp.]|uniref:FGGY-family carbohydrate kinase n=1 Tax=Daejeonella sp. TaxID=2805397 RepID=UPI0030C5C90A
MDKISVIAIFDVGKTNKKIFLLDEQYSIQWESSVKFDEILDEDGFLCDDVHELTKWVKDTFNYVMQLLEFQIMAVNFSAYGASFVHLNNQGIPFLPLYNYLKPYAPDLQKSFYNNYGGEIRFSIETASPVLGNLNSGMQLYRLKYEQADLFKAINVSLHLPQYISYILTNKACSELTSIGCHTNLWNFKTDRYHDWVYKENLDTILAPICDGETVVRIKNKQNDVIIGIGLHDSSAALIPYLISFNDPFILISTGTWCISLNPFNEAPLTEEELKNDCLFFLNYTGRPVKASRLFAGYEHEQQIKRLADHFNKSLDYYATVEYYPEILSSLKKDSSINYQAGMKVILHSSSFGDRDLRMFDNYEQAYHQLIFDIIVQQAASTQLVLKNTDVRRIFVDGGFSKNEVYMFMLASVFPQIEVFAASVAQASAIGAALAIHDHWNNKSLPGNIIDLKYYSSK